MTPYILMINKDLKQIYLALCQEQLLLELCLLQHASCGIDVQFLNKSENFDKKFSFYNGSNSQAICGEGKFIYYENYQDLTVIIPLFRRCNVLINVQYSTQSIRDCAFRCKARRNNSFSPTQTQLSGSLAKNLNGFCCIQLELVQLLGFFDYLLSIFSPDCQLNCNFTYVYSH